MTTSTKELLLDQLNKRRALIHRAKQYPLSVAKLWEPYCHRWDGLSNKSDRDRGCGQRMIMVSPGLYRCDHCNIIEQRTCQKESVLSLGSEATMVSGGNRSGKTQMGCMLAVGVAAGSKVSWVQDFIRFNSIPDGIIQEDPGMVMITALSYSDALEYIRPKLNLFLPKKTIKTRWRSQDRASATLPNGGRILSMSCDSGREKFQGAAFDLIIMDEEPPQPIFEECLLRCVDRRGRVILTCTPLKGLTWMYDFFVEQDIPGFSRVQISGLDNPYISSTKMMRAVSHMSEATKRSRLFGDFTVQSGLVYSEFNPSFHTSEPFDIPENWRRHRSIDFGVTNPFCCLWVAVAPSGSLASDEVLVVYRELYWKGRTTLESGREINRLSGNESYYWTIADPESRDGRLTLARELTPGISTTKAPKHKGVIEGINFVRELLSPDKEDKPQIIIFKNCKSLLREFRLYRWDERKASADRPVKQDDHALDCLRYEALMWFKYNRHK